MFVAAQEVWSMLVRSTGGGQSVGFPFGSVEQSDDTQSLGGCFVHGENHGSYAGDAWCVRTQKFVLA